MVEERAYLYNQVTDKHHVNKYGAAIPPSSLSLLESSEHQKLSTKPRTVDTRSSLLIDANDELGMQLLVSSATIDCQDFRILSFEEVERLKRERTLLANRIDAQTRKLALESKVRDASQNLVKLHANRNKRMSKQAEDQLANATRKVDDLATDLWRLQRREATIKQQLLEHFAGILARSVSKFETAKHDVVYQDFDEEHLYRDAAFSARGSISASSKGERQANRTNLDETVMRAEARLRDTNVQLRNFLSSRAAQQDEDDDPELLDSKSDLETQLNKLDNSLLAFQEQHLEHKEKSLRQLESHTHVLQRLWEIVRAERQGEFSVDNLERGIRQLSSQSDARQRQLEDVNSAQKTSYQQELAALRASHQADLDALHKELELAQQSQHELTRDMTAKRQQIEKCNATIKEHEAKNDDLQSELDEARKQVSQRSVQTSNAAERALIVRLEEELADLQESSENSRSVNHSELLMHIEKIDELERHLADVTQNHDDDRARLMKMTQHLEAHQQRHEDELQALKDHSEALQQDREKALQQVASISTKRDLAVSQISEHKNALVDAENLVDKFKARIQELEQDSIKADEQDGLIADLQREVTRLSTERSILSADLENLKGSQQDIASAQMSAAKDSLVRDLDARIAQQEAELAQLKEVNARLELLLQESQVARSVAATPVVHQGHFGVSDNEQLLEGRCKILQDELLGMLDEYEAMTKSALLYENERTKTENRMDELMDKVLDLEAQLCDERVKSLGLRAANVVETGANDDKNVEPTTAQLRKDFRRLVQEMRSEHAKQTREDYTEIKRLEKQLVDLSQSGRKLSGSV